MNRRPGVTKSSGVRIKARDVKPPGESEYQFTPRFFRFVTGFFAFVSIIRQAGFGRGIMGLARNGALLIYDKYG
jgi:hypothetical protein